MYPMLNHEVALSSKQFSDERDHCVSSSSASSASSLSSSSSTNYFTSAHRFKCFFKKNHQRFNLNTKNKPCIFSPATHLKRKVIYTNENDKSTSGRPERDLIHRQHVQEEEKNQQAKLKRIIFNLNLLNRVQLKYVQKNLGKRSFQNQAMFAKRKELNKQVENNNVDKRISHKEIDVFSWLIIDSKLKKVPKLSNKNLRFSSLSDLSKITTCRREFERVTKEEYLSDSENYYQILEEDSFDNLTSFFTCHTQSLPEVS